MQNNGNQGTWQIAPSVDALQEVNVMTTTYDARYGKLFRAIRWRACSRLFLPTAEEPPRQPVPALFLASACLPLLILHLGAQRGIQARLVAACA